MSYLAKSVPRTGLEPARLAALAPETSASTIPPPGLFFVLHDKISTIFWIGNGYALIFTLFNDVLSECNYSPI